MQAHFNVVGLRLLGEFTTQEYAILTHSHTHKPGKKKKERKKERKKKK